VILWVRVTFYANKVWGSKKVSPVKLFSEFELMQDSHSVQKAIPLQNRCGLVWRTERAMHASTFLVRETQKRALGQSTTRQYFDAASHSLLRFIKREWRKMPRRQTKYKALSQK
jgi:hypothetical protein